MLVNLGIFSQRFGLWTWNIFETTINTRWAPTSYKWSYNLNPINGRKSMGFTVSLGIFHPTYVPHNPSYNWFLGLPSTQHKHTFLRVILWVEVGAIFVLSPYGSLKVPFLAVNKHWVLTMKYPQVLKFSVRNIYVAYPKIVGHPKWPHVKYPKKRNMINYTCHWGLLVVLWGKNFFG